MIDDKTWYLYELIDPAEADPYVVYIGIAVDPSKRMQEHLDGKTKSNRDWIAHLKSQGRRPFMTVIEEGCSEWIHRREAERIGRLGIDPDWFCLNLQDWNPLARKGPRESDCYYSMEVLKKMGVVGNDVSLRSFNAMAAPHYPRREHPFT